MAKQGKRNTYDRIVDASLELFNTEGERKISTNHIAAHLSISPGNLYYHFRNKDEIILQLFKRYRGELSEILNRAETPSDMAGMIDYFLEVFDVMWRYRFLFADVNTLLMRNSELSGEYQNFTWKQVSPMVHKHLQSLIDNGALKGEVLDIDALALNIWLICRYWFVFDGSLNNHHLDEKSKVRGLVQVFNLLRPYVRDEFMAQYNTGLGVLQQRLEAK